MRLGKRLEVKLQHSQQQQIQSTPQDSLPLLEVKVLPSSNPNSDHKSFKYIIIIPNSEKVVVLSEDSTYVGTHLNYLEHGFGKIYIQAIDANFNSEYFVFEGQFEEGSIKGEGIQFYGKSDKKKVQGYFVGRRRVEKYLEFDEEGKPIQPKKEMTQSFIQQQDQQDLESRGQNKMFRIKQPQQQQQQIAQKVIKTWEKYNVKLNKDDQTNLLVEKSLTENTIEAFINYLNHKDASTFFRLSKESDIIAYKRTLVVNSSKLGQIEKLLEEFQMVRRQIWNIYKQILVVVSQNGHYLLLQIVFGTRTKITVYDPISKKKGIFYAHLCKQVWTYFDQMFQKESVNLIWKSEDIVVADCPQLTNAQDSAVFVYKYCRCIIMNESMSMGADEVKQLRQSEIFNIINNK